MASIPGFVFSRSVIAPGILYFKNALQVILMQGIISQDLENNSILRHIPREAAYCIHLGVLSSPISTTSHSPKCLVPPQRNKTIKNLTLNSVVNHQIAKLIVDTCSHSNGWLVFSKLLGSPSENRDPIRKLKVASFPRGLISDGKQQCILRTFGSGIPCTSLLL